MLDQTRAGAAAICAQTVFEISEHDRATLKPLAARVAELAAQPEQAKKRERWQRINTLKKPDRPIILCDPENGWNEIITEDQIECSGELARQWEMSLRKEIFWGESMGDDRVIEPKFVVGHVVSEETDWGLQAQKHSGGAGGSYVWDAPIRSYDEDLPKLRFPSLRVDAAKTADLLSLACDVLGAHLSVTLRSQWWWTLGMTWTCITLRGLQQMMLDMCMEPDNLKKLMTFLRDGTLAQLDYLQANGLLGVVRRADALV